MNNYKTIHLVNGDKYPLDVTAENPVHVCKKICEKFNCCFKDIISVVKIKDISREFCKTTNNAHQSAACINNTNTKKDDHTALEVAEAMIKFNKLGFELSDFIPKKKLGFREWFHEKCGGSIALTNNELEIVQWIEETFI